jgi:hypothetical protein
MKQRWFEREKPQVERTGPIRLQWYRQAGKLQFVSLRSDPVTGSEVAGLTFTVSAEDLRQNPQAVALLESLIARAKGASENWVALKPSRKAEAVDPGERWTEHWGGSVA